MTGVRLPAGADILSVGHRVQSGSEVHPASCPMGTEGSFPGIKVAGTWSCHSPPYSPENKNAWSYIFTPSIRLYGVVLS